MAKTRRTHGWGCPTCNMQCAGFQDADGARQEASIHTTSSGHVTDTFFRVDTQVTTIYPQKREVRVLTALEPPRDGPVGIFEGMEEHSGPSAQEPSAAPQTCSTCGSVGFEKSVLGEARCSFCDGTEGGNPPSLEEVDQARSDFTLEAIKAMDDAVSAAEKPEDKVG